MILRKTLFTEVYSVLTKKYRLLSGKQLAILALLGAVLAVLDLFGLAIIVKILDPQPGSGNSEATKPLFLFFALGLFFLKSVFSVVIHILLTRRLFGLTLHTVKSKYLHYLQPASALERTSSHQALHEMNGLVFSFTEGILLPFVAILSEGILLSAMLLALLLYKPFSTLMLLLVIVPVSAWLLYSNRKALKKNSLDISTTQGQLYKNTSELIRGHTELLLNGIGNEHFKRFVRYAQSHMKLKQEFSVRHGQLPFRILEFSAVLALIILILSGALRDSALIDLAVFGAVAFRMIPAISRIIGSHATLNLHRHLLNFLPEVTDDPLHDTQKTTKLNGFKNHINIEHLRFSYPGKETVINDLSLRIPKNGIIGIKGASGSGKSTLLQIMAGLYTPQSGRILIDDVSLSNVDPKSWHQMVAYVPQNLFIAETSILNNVALSDWYGIPDVEKAMWCLEQASLAAWVHSLPLGIYTPLGEDGSDLSGGQKQRLVLARALYKGAELFLLDEITNALDDDTELQVLHTLNKLREMGKTLMLVSHKTSVLTACDAVWNMDEGKLHPFLSVRIS